MRTRKFLSAALLAGVCGFGLLATSSLASGPLVMPVSVAPHVTPVVKAVPVQTKALMLYREFRTFWLSRGIVR